MKVTSTTLFAYGLLILMGGAMGYFKANSLPSLIAGSSFGIAMILCAWAVSRGKIFAQYIALGLTFILDGFFTYRYAKTLHFIPSGLMSLLSLSVLIVVALKIRKTVSQR